jgi:hypothetical protein
MISASIRSSGLEPAGPTIPVDALIDAHSRRSLAVAVETAEQSYEQLGYEQFLAAFGNRMPDLITFFRPLL